MRRCAALLCLALLAAPATGQKDPKPKPEAKPNAILLIAKPWLPDPNFRETVILVTQSPDQHTVGVILNRPTSRTYDKTGETLYFGGPVMRQAILTVFQAERAPEAAFHVLRGIYLSMHAADVEQALSRRGQRFRLYSGFSGWAPGQLQDEMKRDSWYVLPATEDLLFRPDTSGMWKELLERAQKGQHAPNKV